MKNPEYGMKVTITRSDKPGVELAVNLPVIGARGRIAEICAANPAIASLIATFDVMVDEAKGPKS